MPPLSYSKALCLSSLQLLDVCTLALENSVSHYQLHLFTIKLSDQLYDKGHNGFTHSQCTSLQSKVGEHCTKKKKKKMVHNDSLFNLPKSAAGDYGLRENILKSFPGVKRHLQTPHTNFLPG